MGKERVRLGPNYEEVWFSNARYEACFFLTSINIAPDDAELKTAQKDMVVADHSKPGVASQTEIEFTILLQ